MLRLKLLRHSTSKNCTLGLLYVDGVFNCYTLEDPPQTTKIAGNTRIPAGIFAVKLRKSGGYHQKYGKRFPKMHKGILWLQNVTNFEWVYIHIGNTCKDTKGCILVGSTSQENLNSDGMITDSTLAYKKLYPKIEKVLSVNETVVIEIIDYA